jgi:hypothetical protein
MVASCIGSASQLNHLSACTRGLYQAVTMLRALTPEASWDKAKTGRLCNIKLVSIRRSR